MATAYIGIGGNVGDRQAILRQAVDMLGKAPNVRLLAVSDFIETDPVGPAGQGKYLNAAAAVESDLDAHELLSVLQGIERRLGRDRRAEVRWGPRTCDLDILMFGDEVIETPELVVPHPAMHQRAFVLGPLAQIAPGALHPVLKMTVREMLARLG